MALVRLRCIDIGSSRSVSLRFILPMHYYPGAHRVMALNTNATTPRTSTNDQCGVVTRRVPSVGGVGLSYFMLTSILGDRAAHPVEDLWELSARLGWKQGQHRTFAGSREFPIFPTFPRRTDYSGSSPPVRLEAVCGHHQLATARWNSARTCMSCSNSPV